VADRHEAQGARRGGGGLAPGGEAIPRAPAHVL
jgi:hypothetical protein